MRKLMWMLVLATACSSEVPPEGTSVTEQASTIVTVIKVNGRFATVLLADTGTNGIVTASKDGITNTTALDFSYVEPHATDPTLLVFLQGAGQIANNKFTINGQTASLNVTTPFAVTRCEVVAETGEVLPCTTSAPITFNLTWVNNLFGSLQEKTKRLQVFGPVTTKFEGEVKSRTATVTGTWTGHTAASLDGELLQTVNTTLTREITMVTP